MRRREFLASAAGVGLAGTAASEPPTAPVALELTDLDRAVQSVLTSKRLGQPVFVRLTRRGTSEAVGQLASLATIATRWLGQKPTRMHAIGGIGAPASVTLLYADGASAIVSVTNGEPAGALEVMLLGNRGSMHHEATVVFTSGSEPTDVKLERAVWHALRKGTPISVEAS